MNDPTISKYNVPSTFGDLLSDSNLVPSFMGVFCGLQSSNPKLCNLLWMYYCCVMKIVDGR
jgi:hypothetical protein